MPFPDLANLDRLAIGFALTVFRVAGLMLFAPLFGSGRVPKRVKVLMALVISFPMILAANAKPVPMPLTTGQVVVGLAGEILIGIAMGMVASFTFIAAQWAGEMVGQQIGLNIAEVLDPQFGGAGSIVGDLYFMLATCVFLTLGGHRMLVMGVYDSLTAFPPLSLAFTQDVLDTVLGFFMGATSLALRLAAPMFVTMVIVDTALGCISKTIPQMNVMSAGMAIRAMMGMFVLALGAGVTATALEGHLSASLRSLMGFFSGGGG